MGAGMLDSGWVDVLAPGVALLLAALLGAWIFARLRRARSTRAAARRHARGLDGQRRARGLLEARGYRVLAEEPEVEGAVVVDGREHRFTVRPDYLVRRRGRTYVVEVKTGSAANPGRRAVRRQLLEYQRLLAADGLFLLDMDAGQLHRVWFPAARRARSGAGRALAALLAGALLGAWLAMLLGQGL